MFIFPLTAKRIDRTIDFDDINDVTHVTTL